MVERNFDEIAVIFEPITDEGNILSFVPVDVKLGHFSDIDDVFIDNDSYTYSHVFDINFGKGYAYKENISDLLSNSPDKSLNQIRFEILEEVKKYKYVKGYLEGTPVVYGKDLNGGEYFLLEDEYTKDILMLFDENERKNIDYTVESYDSEELVDEILEPSLKPLEKTYFAFNTHKLYKEIRKNVIGQDEAIKKIVTTIWENQISENTSNMIVLGPSGVGKTEIFRQISSKLNIPLLITSVTGLSQAGYVGGSTEDILSDLLTLTAGDVDKAEHAIVILDEFDKIAYRGHDSGSISTDGIQSELLKIVEDGTFGVNYVVNGQKCKDMLSTKNITFVGVGAFVDLLTTEKNKELGFGADIYSKVIDKNVVTSEDLIKFGLKPEIVGRMGKIVKLNSLTLENMKNIVKMKYTGKIDIIKSLNINLNLDNEDMLIEKIAELALKKKVGARAIDSVIDEVFSDLMFDVSDDEENYQSLEISDAIVDDHKKYILRK